MKISKSLSTMMIFIMLKNKSYLLILLFLFLLSFYPVCENIIGAGTAGFWPLINIRIINHYPAILLGSAFNVIQVFLIIFLVCLAYGVYIENQSITLPLFYGYTRKHIFQSCCISLNVVILGTYLLYFVMLLIAGLPLEILYQGNKSLFNQFGALTAPLNINNTVTVFAYLMLQYISVLPAISFCILMNVLFQKRMIAGGMSCLCYVLSLWINWAGIGKWYYYQNHFIEIIVAGDEVYYSYLSNLWGYLAGIFSYALIAFILLKIAEWKFLQLDF